MSQKENLNYDEISLRIAETALAHYVEPIEIKLENNTTANDEIIAEPNKTEYVFNPNVETVKSNEVSLIKLGVGEEKNVITSDLKGNTAVTVLAEKDGKIFVYTQNYNPENNQKSINNLGQGIKIDMPKGTKVHRVLILTPNKQSEYLGEVTNIPEDLNLVDSLEVTAQENAKKADIQTLTYDKNESDKYKNKGRLRVECLSDGTVNFYTGSTFVPPTPED